MEKRACLALPLGKCFNCACLLAILFGGMPRMYKITVSKGDIRKHAKSMLNVSGMFFITRGVSSLMNGKRRKIPVTPPECELQ